MRDDLQLKYLFYEAANKPMHFRLVFSYAKKHGQRHYLYNKLFYSANFSNNYQIENSQRDTLGTKNVDERPDMNFQIMRQFYTYAFRPNIRGQS